MFLEKFIALYLLVNSYKQEDWSSSIAGIVIDCTRLLGCGAWEYVDFISTTEQDMQQIFTSAVMQKWIIIEICNNNINDNNQCLSSVSHR